MRHYQLGGGGGTGDSESQQLISNFPGVLQGDEQSYGPLMKRIFISANSRRVHKLDESGLFR
ncbi:hypothetical protein Esi_0103_0056 [Ectocarpus siliculosus]|uniref:Uncharacterized protein n=1 Tax=Ectocarpus siliculosus TaxID=2880 RepID=D8LCG3_ECTSI|nr:hypothetical protein Esi_0103_0056 [Ectocarpus siliculosus]|eukprot:CBN78199.1 hypothetical protein Esi_0103_0056 [Ectocarpus siliculosus]